MTHNVSRRTLAKGAAWAAPAVASTTLIPAYAASKKGIYFNCPTQLADLTAKLTATISAYSVNTAYDSGAFLAPLHQSGTLFGMSYDTGAVKPVPIYNSNGTQATNSSGKPLTSSGAYLIPGCGKNTCAPDVSNGFLLPMGDVVVYDRNGLQHQGSITSWTPSGCSPVTNLGIGGSFSLVTDLQYGGGGCLPDAGPENMIRQISIPVSLMYLNGLDIVNTQSGGSCCLYMNFYFNDTYPCPGTAVAVSADYTFGLPPAPTAADYAPHLGEWYRIKDGREYNNFSRSAANNEFYLSGSNFTGTTSVTWNNVEVPFEVVSDNLIKITFPLTSSHADGIFYPVKVTNAVGASINSLNMTRYF